MATEELKKLVKELERSFARWKHLKEYGGNDPFWEDGVNMNLVRNHIFYYRNQIEKICREAGLPLPDIYNVDPPPEVPNNYMARIDEIREKAKEVLVMFENDENFKKLKRITGVPKEKIQEVINVLGYVNSLRMAIQNDDLVAMRRYAFWPQGYLESARRMAEKLIEEDYAGQLSMFHLLHAR